MTDKKPLKRDKSLRPLSIDHHHGLLLSWKIRRGIEKEIDPERISTYARWFFEQHLAPHFELEERYVFTVLEPDDELVLRALEEHEKIRAIANLSDPFSLSKFADTLEAHIRFEERVLFEKVQSVATPAQLEQIASIHRDEAFVEQEDQFWK